MASFKHSMILALAVLTAASVAAVPAYADDDTFPEITVEQPEKPKPVEKEADKPKPVCTPTELEAFRAAAAKAEKAEKAAKAAKAKQEAEAHKAEHAKDAVKAGGAEKPKSAAERAAEEKAHALKKAAHACAAAKQKAAAEAKKEADRKARARRFQAIGVVDVSDAAAGTVTVMIKAGSPDLHKRKLAIKVTSETRIQLDGEKVALADLVSGTFVSVHGVRHEGMLVAGKINAASPGIEDSHDEPAPSAAPAAD